MIKKVKDKLSHAWPLFGFAALGLGFLTLHKKIANAAATKTFDTSADKIAYQVADKMGTIYSYWDPRSWIEDDEGIIELIQHHQDIYPDIAKSYAKYVGSSLSKDIVRLVDDYHPIAHLL